MIFISDVSYVLVKNRKLVSYVIYTTHLNVREMEESMLHARKKSVSLPSHDECWSLDL